MLTRSLYSLTLGLLAGVAGWTAHQYQEHETNEEGARTVKLSDAPESVQSSIKKAAGSSTIDSVKMEMDDGVTIYEASWKVDGVTHETSVDSAGNIIETERSVSNEEVPQAVRNAAAKHLPAGSKPEFELKMIMLYSAEADANGKEIEILIDPAGRLMELDAEDEHDHAEQEGDDDDDDSDSEEDDDDDDDDDDGEDDDDDDDGKDDNHS
ncbi:MAG: hypothetical protein R3C03_06825 [Pirellulaceae bacterium]